MAPLDSAVKRFQRRIGPSAVFDLDDARQVGMIAAWENSDGRQSVLYNSIVDAVRAVIPGFRQRQQFLAVGLDAAPEEAHNETPEAICEARQRLAIMRSVAMCRGVDIVSATLDGENQRSIAKRAGVQPEIVSQRIKDAIAAAEGGMKPSDRAQPSGVNDEHVDEVRGRVEREMKCLVFDVTHKDLFVCGIQVKEARR